MDKVRNGLGRSPLQAANAAIFFLSPAFSSPQIFPSCGEVAVTKLDQNGNRVFRPLLFPNRNWTIMAFEDSLHGG